MCVQQAEKSAAPKRRNAEKKVSTDGTERAELHSRIRLLPSVGVFAISMLFVSIIYESLG
jgi:hypothetical protein